MCVNRRFYWSFIARVEIFQIDIYRFVGALGVDTPELIQPVISYFFLKMIQRRGEIVLSSPLEMREKKLTACIFV